jgi:hypothetical protein
VLKPGDLRCNWQGCFIRKGSWDQENVAGKSYWGQTMQQNYHDCMAICCAYGPPDKFTTMTCNSNWPEIKEALQYEPGQKSSDRADVVVRLFHMKLEEYLEDIKGGHIFGPVHAGLP